MGFRQSFLVILFLTLCCWSHPLDAAERGKKSFVAKIKRSSGQPPPVQDAASRVFDPTYATEELKGLVGKYAQASQFLAGVGLNPDQHPEAGYEPFTHPLVGALNTTNSTAYNVTTDSRTKPIMVQNQNGSASVLPVPGLVQSPLTDYNSDGLDILYYGPLQFGSQGQSLTVDIDTGSADLWVPVNCRACGGNSFSAAQSTTYSNLGQKFSVFYGAGHVSGTVARDTVTVGRLVVKQQGFGAVRSESEDFYDQPSDGLLGLAFGTIAQSKQSTFFENLMMQKQVAAGAFAVHLARGQATGSEICFGCFDTTKALGPVTWNPIASRVGSVLSVVLDNQHGRSFGRPVAQRQDEPHSGTSTQSAIDTGTTLIYLPDEAAAQFYATIPGSSPAVQYGSGFYTYPCSAPLTPSLSFGGKSYSINTYDFNLGRTSTDSQDCVGGILAMGKGFPPNLAIIGYSVYDYPGSRVGFAPSINNQ
ncbi:hypothetical protein IEO21_05486 [Rhodonia placenta]|uniref:Peptidase A1 domain-containing protein n=1 Tax=Rhodonia placenta TaxID=104341 RepID=A0A8H7P1W2_9APHY|nr:hypothetical protein IEO21_05486 [Postia placenta]